ncbi:MAG: hypothetical protein ACW97Z_13335 [Candidatus Hodarchaeales archaeon]|jgi:hypothetical protein
MSSETTEDSLVTKNDLHELGVVATELRSIDPTVQVISSLNESQKLITQIQKIEKDLTTAGFFKKRGLSKSLSQKKNQYNKTTEKLLNTVLAGYRRIYFDLAKNIKEIAKFVPQETGNIKNIQIPSLETTLILKFSNAVLKIYNKVAEVLKGKNISTLLFNREIIELYGKFVNFDEEKIRISSQTSKASIHVMIISDLLDLYNNLEAENAYLKQRRKGTEGKIQAEIVRMASTLHQHLGTISSIGIKLSSNIETLQLHIQEIQGEADTSTSVEKLIELEKRLSSLRNEFINSLRTYEISLKTETEDQIGRIIQLVGDDEIDSSIVSAPIIDVSASEIPVIIQDIEKIRSWHAKLIIALKKLVSTAELINAGKTLQVMKFPVPDDFFDDVKSIEKETEKTSELQLWVKLVKRYYDFRFALAAECQNYFFQMLENPHIQEAISLTDGPPIPAVKDFESLSPGQLVIKAREIKDWEARLVAYFSKPAQQNLRQNLISLYDTRESLKDLLDDDLVEEIENLREYKSEDEKEVRDLVKEIDYLNQLSAKIRRVIWVAIDSEIHPIANQITTLETIPPKLKAHVPNLELEDLKSIREEIEISTQDKVKNLLDEFEKITIWKYKISTRIRENIKGISFPLIPIETRFDLREKRTEIVKLIDSHAEVGNIEAIVREYLSFLETIEDMKTEILLELKKQIDGLEAVDKRLFRLMKSGTSSVSYSSESELENLDYSEALTEYWQLLTFVDRKISTLAELMNREILSHIQDYSKLPPQYSAFFEEPLALMNKKLAEFQTHKDIVRLVDSYESYSLESMQLAKDSLIKLHQNLYNWLRVSLPRIHEISPLSDSVFAAEQKIYNFQPEEVSHERLAHDLRQLIYFYDTEIVAVLLSHGVSKSREVLKDVNDLKEVGINIIEYVGSYIESFSEVIVKHQEDVHLREITEVFVEIDKLQNDNNACNAIRTTGERYIAEIQDTIEYLFGSFQIDLRAEDRIDFAYLSDFQRIATNNHVHHLTQAIIKLNQIRAVVVELMKVIEKDRNANLQTKLGTLDYYSNIQEVFKQYSDEASERIYPLSKLLEERAELMNTHDLRLILNLFPKIESQREEWEKVSIQLNRWHSAFRMFRARYLPSENIEENKRQFKEISKKIADTYPRNKVIGAYLSLVMKLFIEIKSGIELE